MEGAMSVGDVMNTLESTHGVPLERQVITGDPAGKEPLLTCFRETSEMVSAEAGKVSLDSLGVGHGDMLYLQGTLTKNGDGAGRYIVAFEDEDVQELGAGPGCAVRQLPDAASTEESHPASIPMTAAGVPDSSGTAPTGVDPRSRVIGEGDDSEFPVYDAAAFEAATGDGLTGTGAEFGRSDQEGVRAPDQQVRERLIDDYYPDDGIAPGGDIDLGYGHYIPGGGDLAPSLVAALSAAQSTSQSPYEAGVADAVARLAGSRGERFEEDPELFQAELQEVIKELGGGSEFGEGAREEWVDEVAAQLLARKAADATAGNDEELARMLQVAEGDVAERLERERLDSLRAAEAASEDRRARMIREANQAVAAAVAATSESAQDAESRAGEYARVGTFASQVDGRGTEVKDDDDDDEGVLPTGTPTALPWRSGSALVDDDAGGDGGEAVDEDLALAIRLSLADAEEGGEGGGGPLRGACAPSSEAGPPLPSVPASAAPSAAAAASATPSSFLPPSSSSSSARRAGTRSRARDSPSLGPSAPAHTAAAAASAAPAAGDASYRRLREVEAKRRQRLGLAPVVDGGGEGGAGGGGSSRARSAADPSVAAGRAGTRASAGAHGAPAAPPHDAPAARAPPSRSQWSRGGAGGGASLRSVEEGRYLRRQEEGLQRNSERNLLRAQPGGGGGGGGDRVRTDSGRTAPTTAAPSPSSPAAVERAVAARRRVDEILRQAGHSTVTELLQATSSSSFLPSVPGSGEGTGSGSSLHNDGGCDAAPGAEAEDQGKSSLYPRRRLPGQPPTLSSSSGPSSTRAPASTRRPSSGSGASPSTPPRPAGSGSRSGSSTGSSSSSLAVGADSAAALAVASPASPAAAYRAARRSPPGTSSQDPLARPRRSPGLAGAAPVQSPPPRPQRQGSSREAPRTGAEALRASQHGSGSTSSSASSSFSARAGGRGRGIPNAGGGRATATTGRLTARGDGSAAAAAAAAVEERDAAMLEAAMAASIDEAVARESAASEGAATRTGRRSVAAHVPSQPSSTQRRTSIHTSRAREASAAAGAGGRSEGRPLNREEEDWAMAMALAASSAAFEGRMPSHSEGVDDREEIEATLRLSLLESESGVDALSPGSGHIPVDDEEAAALREAIEASLR